MPPRSASPLQGARLYADVQRAETALRRANDELEKRVEERTRELRQAQAQLVETVRSAGMAEVATSVLHNVGNVLTSAIINVQMMSQTVDTSRLGRVKQVSALIEEHRPRLADFLTRDPRGAHLPDYLSALAEELPGVRMSPGQVANSSSARVPPHKNGPARPRSSGGLPGGSLSP